MRSYFVGPTLYRRGIKYYFAILCNFQHLLIYGYYTYQFRIQMLV